jgi:signal transduction histidine kinase
MEQAAEIETLRAVDRARTELLAAVSHELHPPLALVVAYGELIEHQAVDAESREVASKVVETGGRLTGLVNDLLDAARLETGRYTLNRHVADLGRLVLSAVDVARATNPTIEFVVDLPADPVHAEVDPSRMLQVLGNLLSNAACHGLPAGIVRVGVHTADQTVGLFVEDDGPGIPLADRERVFDKFHRGPGTEGRPGLGLGLSIARDLVVAHDGSIRVEGAEPSGARFIIDLPRHTT